MNTIRSNLFVLNVFLVLLSTGCRPDAGTAAPGKDTSLPPVTFTQPWNPSATKTASNTRLAASSTSSETRTLPPPRTPPPTQTKTSRPTHIPTPTRGLPPTITLSPKEECPPPTYEKVDIQFSEDIWGYGPQILDYFRAYGDRTGLKEQFERMGKTIEEPVKEEPGKTRAVFFPDRVDFTEADVTGDTVKETLIILKQYDGRGLGQYEYYELIVFVVRCRNRQYTLTSLNTFEAPHFQMIDGNLGNLEIRDLDADGIQEILLITSGMEQGSNPWMFYPTFELEIYGWDGNTFQGVPPFALGFIVTAIPEIWDIDGNGTQEILVTSEWPIHECGEGPRGQWRFVYMWNGDKFVEMWRDPGDPVYRFQAAFAGDYYTTIALYDRAEASYRKAVGDPSLRRFDFPEWAEENFGRSCGGVSDPSEAQRIAAYARLRLLELLVFLRKTAVAESEWKFMTENPREADPGYAYSRLADAFWRAYSENHDLGEACSAVRSAAEQNTRAVFDWMEYGTYNLGPTPETICPFIANS